LIFLEDGTEIEEDDYLDHVVQHSILLAKLPGQGKYLYLVLDTYVTFHSFQMMLEHNLPKPLVVE
jgi:hypothetical protein